MALYERRQNKFVKMFKSKALVFSLLGFLFISSAMIITAMMMGNEAGNFVVQVVNGDMEKTLSITRDIDDESSFTGTLRAPAMLGMTDSTLDNITHNGREDLLTFIDATYDNNSGLATSEDDINQAVFIYTFYIVNTSDIGVDVGITMNISHITKNIDEAIRIMTYDSTNDIAHVYQKADETKHDYENYYYTPQEFESDGVIVANEGDGTHIMGNGQTEKSHHMGSKYENQQTSSKYIKYSVIVWLEGQDEWCDQRILGGSFKFDMKISILN